MSISFEDRPRSAPLPRWLSPHNPFYVISAGLFLLGLWRSMGGDDKETEVWGLMAGLTGYTLLLAGTAFILVRHLRVWDDARTVLLLVVLMFLATSVTFDEALVIRPALGQACYLVGLGFAVLVSEGLLRGLRLPMPIGFRGPYYLILALFFLYPVFLGPLLDRPRSEGLQWGLFCFSTVAGLAFLTLIPAIRGGPRYIAAPPGPWRWPLYPWAVFGLLALAVPGRAYLICRSLHWLDRVQGTRVIFGPYFLIPFGLALAVLLLEIGIVARSRSVKGIALCTPAGLIALALTSAGGDPIYRGFLDLFQRRLGADPLLFALLVTCGFFAFAALRRVSYALDGLLITMLAIAFVGPDTLETGQLVRPSPLPFLAAATLQVLIGVWQRSSARCLVGVLGLLLAAAVGLRGPHPGLILFHLTLLAAWMLGAAFDDELARTLRIVAAGLVGLFAIAAFSGASLYGPDAPPWLAHAHLLALTGFLAGYGWKVGHPLSVGVAAMIAIGWGCLASWRFYQLLRRQLDGFDYLAASLLLFAVAVLCSLLKSSGFQGWWSVRNSGSIIEPDDETVGI